MKRFVKGGLTIEQDRKRQMSLICPSYDWAGRQGRTANGTASVAANAK